MKLYELKIRNFKGISSLDLDFGGEEPLEVLLTPGGGACDWKTGCLFRGIE